MYPQCVTRKIHCGIPAGSSSVAYFVFLLLFDRASSLNELLHTATHSQPGDAMELA